MIHLLLKTVQGEFYVDYVGILESQRSIFKYSSATPALTANPGQNTTFPGRVPGLPAQ